MGTTQTFKRLSRKSQVGFVPVIKEQCGFNRLKKGEKTRTQFHQITISICKKQSIYISLTRRHPCDLKHSLFGSMHGMTPLYSLHVIHPPRMITNCPDYLSICLLQSPRFSLITNTQLKTRWNYFLSWKDFLIVENVKDIFLVISNVSSHFNSTKLVSNVKSLFSLTLCNLTNGLH